MMNSKIMALLVALVLSGCVTVPPAKRIPDPEKYAVDGSVFPGAGTVYFFRGAGRAASMATFEIRVDGTAIANIRKKQHVAIPVAEGTHQIFVGCTNGCGYPGVNMEAEFRTGRTYFFMIGNDASVRMPTISLQTGVDQIDSSDASRLMQEFPQAKQR
jgi:hypothetical protein